MQGCRPCNNHFLAFHCQLGNLRRQEFKMYIRFLIPKCLSSKSFSSPRVLAVAYVCRSRILGTLCFLLLNSSDSSSNSLVCFRCPLSVNFFCLVYLFCVCLFHAVMHNRIFWLLLMIIMFLHISPLRNANFLVISVVCINFENIYEFILWKDLYLRLLEMVLR